ncbi:MAG: FtsX-like permease family protein [bacterium]
MKIFVKIGLRYLFSKRQITAINIISFLSLTGIALGVAALIIVLSVFSGFNDLAEEQLTGFDPHIRIQSKIGDSFKIDSQLISAISHYPKLKNYEKIVKTKSIAISNSGLQVFDLVSYSSEKSPFYSIIFSKYLVKGTPNFLNENEDLYLGFKIADLLDKMPNENINLTSPKMLDKSLLSFRPLKNINVNLSGLVYSNIKNYDAEVGFAKESNVRKLALIPNDEFSSIDIRLNSKDDTDDFYSYIKPHLNKNLQILNWKDLNDKLLQIMQLERIATFLILGIIILIAVFNILTSLTMTVLEKQYDIGLLRALGCTKSIIKKIFLAEGVIIGLLSTIIGLILGLSFYYLQINYSIIKLDTTKYIIDSLPISLSFAQVLVISLFSILLSVGASIFPAKRANEINIVNALREE